MAARLDGTPVIHHNPVHTNPNRYSRSAGVSHASYAGLDRRGRFAAMTFGLK
jgi:hypothetical protein